MAYYIRAPWVVSCSIHYMSTGYWTVQYISYDFLLDFNKTVNWRAALPGGTISAKKKDMTKEGYGAI